MQKVKNFFGKFKFVILLIVIGGAIILFISKLKSQQKVSNLEIYTLKRKDLKEELILSGEVKAEKQVELKFKNVGKLVWVGVKEGDKVKKGQAIASLDKRALEKELRKYLRVLPRLQITIGL